MNRSDLNCDEIPRSMGPKQSQKVSEEINLLNFHKIQHCSLPLVAELLEIYMVQQVIGVLQENGIFRFGLVILSSIRY